jgi:hypothetical protein
MPSLDPAPWRRHGTRGEARHNPATIVAPAVTRLLRRARRCDAFGTRLGVGSSRTTPRKEDAMVLVVIVSEADGIAPILTATADWDDVFEMTVSPAIAAALRMELVKESMLVTAYR